MATYTKNFSSGWAQLILTVSESGTSATTNAGKVSWSLKIKMITASASYNSGGADISVTIGGTKRYTGNSFDVRGVGKGSSKTIASGSFTQSHSADGSLSLSCSASFDSGVSLGSASISGTFTGTTIPRATQPSVSPTTAALGSSVTISTPRASSSFTHKLFYKIGSGSWEDIKGNIGTSHPWTVPKEIANSFTGGSSGKIIIAADTYNGSTMIGSKQVGLDIKIPTTSEFQPAVNSLSVSEAVSKVTAAFGSRYVQGLSRLNVSVSASGAYGSTIKAYSTPVDGVNYNSASFTSNVINSSGTLSIKATVSDSRGRSASKTVNMSVLPYSPPAITALTYLQCNADGTANPSGTSTKVTISGTIASVDGQNSRNLTLKWKKSTDTLYQSKTFTISDWTFTVSNIINDTAIDETYEFVAVLADKVNTVQKEVTTGIIAMSFLAGGKGARLFGEAENEGFWVGDTNVMTTLANKANLKAPNNFIHSGNEMTTVPSGYTGDLWFNYRTEGGTNGNIGTYILGNGAGSYTNMLCKDLKITGTLSGSVSDYIVANGVSSDGVWYYRKYNSGKCECWAYKNVELPANSVTKFTINLPFKFTKEPPYEVFTSFVSNTTNAKFGLCTVMGMTGSQSTLTSVSFQCANAHTGNFSPRVFIRVIGTWK